MMNNTIATINEMNYLYDSENLFGIYNNNKNMSKEFKITNKLFKDLTNYGVFQHNTLVKLGFKFNQSIMLEYKLGSLEILIHGGDEIFIYSEFMDNNYYFSNYALYEGAESMDVVEFIDKFIELYNLELDWLRYQSSSSSNGRVA